MTSTVCRLLAVTALVSAFAVGAAALSFTIGKAADACAVRSDSIVNTIAPHFVQSGTALSIFDRDCLDWSPLEEPTAIHP